MATDDRESVRINRECVGHKIVEIGCDDDFVSRFGKHLCEDRVADVRFRILHLIFEIGVSRFRIITKAPIIDLWIKGRRPFELKPFNLQIFFSGPIFDWIGLNILHMEFMELLNP